jgi:hypothetical protein
MSAKNPLNYVYIAVKRGLTHKGNKDQNVVDANRHILHVFRCHTQKDSNGCQNGEDDRAGIDFGVMVLILKNSELLRTQACGKGRSKR